MLFSDQVGSVCIYTAVWLIHHGADQVGGVCVCVNFFLSVFQTIPMTPIRIKVDPSHDASKVKAEGPGLNRSGETHTHMLKTHSLTLTHA